MKANNTFFKQIAKLGLLLMMTLSMSACSKTSSWKEEVLLHDGSKIIVDRIVGQGGRHEIGQQPPIKEQSLTFMMPKTNESVTWKSGFSADIGFADFQPLLLDISSDTAYVLTFPVGCLSYNKWGRPNPSYIVFKYQGGEWVRIKFAELPAEFKDFNLIISSPDENAKRLAINGLVSAEKIKEFNTGHRGYIPLEYKTILREPLKAGTLGTDGSSVNCEVMVRFEGGWAGPDYVEMTKRHNLQLKKQREQVKQNATLQK